MYHTISLVAVLMVASLAPASAAQPADAPRAIEVGYGPAGESPAPGRPLIRLRSGSLDTTSADAVSADGRPVIVQFDRPLGADDIRLLTELGAEILSALPDHAFRVRMREPERLSQLGGVRWVGRIAPDRLVHPDVTGGSEQIVRVVLDPGSDLPATVRAAEAAGATVLRTYSQGFLMRADRMLATDVAAAADAVWVEPWSLHTPHNEFGGERIGSSVANDLGYDGSSQIVAVADTGLGGGTAEEAHPDIPASRIVDIQDYSAENLIGCYTVFPDGAIDPDSGHGTHVAGTVLSDGDGFGAGRGVAPGASLLFQAVEEYLDVTFVCGTDGYYLIGIPLDLAELLQDAYDVGARVHQDSWGAAAPGEYTADAAAVDGFVWEHQDLLMVVSAGNEGVDADGNGEVDPDSIGSPATAKNVLAVGASENARPDAYPCDVALAYTTCADDGGINEIFTYGDAWPDDYPAPPLFDDPSAGNSEQLAAFSSRGPTDDGRLKPDVVAPGTWVLSTYSNRYQEGYGTETNPQTGLFQYDGYGYPYSAEYKYMSGTSMSAPMASGAAAVVRDFYVAAHGLDWISAALVKATLINSAVDLLDENNDGSDDNDHPIPNHHEGWGRIDLAAATDSSHAWFDNGEVETGMQRSYVTAVTAAAPLKVTLVWSDYAGAEGCGACLVHDLNLVLTHEDGSTYVGNNFADGWSVAGPGTPDDANNVENVFIDAPQAGAWTIDVIGVDVALGPQPFALVIDAAFDETVDVTAPTWTDGQVEPSDVTETAATVTWSAATDNVGVATYVVYLDDLAVTEVTATQAKLTDLAPDTTYTVRIEARDISGNLSTDGPTTTITTPQDFADTNGHTFEDDIAWLSLTGITQGCDADGNFCPDDPMTRAQMASLLARALELEIPKSNRFTDVSGTHAGNINAIAEAGITIGCDSAGTEYCPEDLVTRAQMATFIDRAFPLTTSSTDFFTDDDGSTHEAAINRVAETGITLGCDADGHYCPSDHVTRGQIAAFLHRTFVNLDLE